MRKFTLISSFIFMALFPIANLCLAADSDTSALAPPLSAFESPNAGGSSVPESGQDNTRGALDLPLPQEGSAPIEAGSFDPATLANVSLDDVMLPAAAGAEQQAQLDAALRVSPDAAPALGAAPETTGTDQAPANPLALASAIGATSQEAALLGTGAPVDGEVGERPSHDMAQCFTLFKEFTGLGFQEVSQGLETGNLPEGITPDMAKGMVETFNRVHESFEKLSEKFGEAAFGGLGEGEKAGLPGLGNLPIGNMPVLTGPEGQAMPMPMMMPMVGVGDFSAVLNGAILGVDPKEFGAKMEQMVQNRQEAFQNFVEQKGFDPNAMPGNLPGDMPNPASFASPGEFLAQFGGPNNPAFQPGPGMMGPGAFFQGGPNNLPGGQPFMPDGQNSPFQGDFNFGNMIGSEFGREIAQAIAGDLTQQFIAQQVRFENLPPEALQTLAALNANFTAADLVFLQNNPGQNITREFSAEITSQFRNTNNQSVAFVGDEHIHVTYARDPNTVPPGDSLMPVDHIDANVTAIHSADHTQTAQLPAEAAHIPGIQA